MEFHKIKLLLILVFLAITFIGNAQLIDPFGKVITHEIKLKKLKDSTRAGAIEWTTGGLDSLQRFVISGLDVKSPVMVRIISKAPDHNIDLSFHKNKWDKVESKISTNGDKFVEKTFRTMNEAGLGVSSKVAGIPYLITVKVGLQFPSTQSLIRVTDNKEEYVRHMRRMGFSGQLFEDDNSNSSTSSNGESNNSNGGNSTLTYIIIGLLSIIIILLAVFLLKRKSTKNTTLVLILLCSSQFSFAQMLEPKLVPVDGQGNSPVFYEYSTQNVESQKTVPILKPRVRDTNVTIPLDESGTFIETRPVRIESNPDSIELSPQDVEDLTRRMGASDEEFSTNYGEGSPGENTEGEQRTLPVDIIQEELDALRRQVQQLQQQVDLLSQDDEDYDRDDDGGGEMLLYCEDIQACQRCLERTLLAFSKHRAYFDFMQKYYLRRVTVLNQWIEYGNAMSALPGGGGMAWGPILLYKVRPSMDKLTEVYNERFDGYIASMEEDLEGISACYGGPNGRFNSRAGYEAQMFSVLEALKASRIYK